MSDNYGQRLTAAITKAAGITAAADVPVETRQEEVIDLALQRLTKNQMRALYVSRYSGQMLPRSWDRARVTQALRVQALADVRNNQGS